MKDNLTVGQYATIAGFAGLAALGLGAGAFGLVHAFNTASVASVIGNALTMTAGALSAKVAHNVYSNDAS